MSEEANPDPDVEGPPSVEEPGAAELKSLLRHALDDDMVAPREMLPEVQRKLRERSRGKFYADGWSTAKHAPISTYLITSLFMLAVIGVAYAILSQLSGEAARTRTVPTPVQVIPAPGQLEPPSSPVR